MSIPRVIYGTAWKKQRTTELVVAAVLNGFRAIDTAGQPKHYSQVEVIEALVGQALKVLKEEHTIKREDIFVQSKFTSPGGHDLTKPIPYALSDPLEKQINDSFNSSLANLQSSYLDSYLLHSPLDTLEHTLEAWRVLASLQDKGMCKNIGVSNAYDVETLVALGKERKVQIVQNRWWEGNKWDVEVWDYCRANDIQYQSFWTLSGSPSFLQHPFILELAQMTGCSPAQVIFKYAQERGVTPLSGTTQVQHMQESIEVEKLELGSLQQIDNFIRS